MTETQPEQLEASTNGAVFTDVIVAIHGIGEQARFATVRSVATRLARSDELRRNGHGPIPIQPLGYFHGDAKKFTSLILAGDAENLKDTELAKIGFAEVYWADIPDDVLKEGRTLEETKAWARTVVARAEALCAEASRNDSTESIIPPDFEHAGDVLEEVIDTVFVMENLVALAAKAGVFKFDLRRVLMEYLGDVQLVAEFAYHRKNIIGRFHRAMDQVYNQCQKNCPGARIHIVAHSEGTVISFLGLLWAMSKRTFIPEDPDSPNNREVKDGADAFPNWLKHVHGFMTIGSPIDKHLLLWPRLWTSPLFKPQLVNDWPDFKPRQIRWRNYYDYGDPVGFKLDSARLWLSEIAKCNAFEFCGCEHCHHDIGFARYLLPGEAHNEYWNDSAVFKHFISNVVKRAETDTGASASTAPAPKSKWYIALFSPVLPYILSLLLIAAGVFVLFKAAYAYAHPSLDPLQKFVRFSQLGAHVTGQLSTLTIFRAIAGMTALVAGAVVLARVPHLALTWPWTRTRRLIRKVAAEKSKKLTHRLVERFGPKLSAAQKLARKSPIRMWTLAGLLGFLIGCGGYIALVPQDLRDDIGSPFKIIERLQLFPNGWAPTIAVLVLAILTAALSECLVAKRKPKAKIPLKPNWRRSWIFQGLRPFVILGSLVVFVPLVIQLQPPGKEDLGLTAEDKNRLAPDDLKLVRDARFSSNELAQVKAAKGNDWLVTVKKVAPALALDPPVWPVVLASLAFVYLCWLATLIFDLAFIWHRYIRHSVTNDRLRQWNPYGFSRHSESGEEECCLKKPSPLVMPSRQGPTGASRGI
jgi:hypothetical protein